MLRQANLLLLPFNRVELNIQKEIWVDEYVHSWYSFCLLLQTLALIMSLYDSKIKFFKTRVERDQKNF